MKNKERLLHYLKPHRKLLSLAFYFALIFVISQLSEPFLLGKALDASKDNNHDIFYIYLIIATILVFVGTILNYFFELIISNISQRIIKEARDDIYKKLNAISVKDFDNKARGDLLMLEIRDMENYSAGLFAIFKTLMQGIFTIIITIILMVTVNWILALGVFFLSPLSYLMARFVSRFSHHHFKKRSELQADISALSLETINNIEIVQSLNYEEEALRRFKEKNDVLRKETTIAQFSASWVNPSTRLVNNTIYVIIGIVGIIMLSYEPELAAVFAVMSIGRLSSFLSYTNQYTKPFNEISGVANEYESAKASFSRINAFLNLEDDKETGNKEINEINEIEFKDMSFSYIKEKELIKNLNLKIHKGNKVAIVGPTGAGKTTLINILMRFYDPNEGTILINDESYFEYTKSSLRKNIGMVLQDTWIFKGTILDNIRYYKPNASIDEVKEAAVKAHANLFIEAMPYGYDTIISTHEGLSEGQKQMIAIARVMLLNPNIIILDEATSNIDTRSEKLINDAFDKMMKEKTSIVIAHRLSTILEADVIIVMKDGKIIETGKHKELLEKKGFYYSLYSSQYK